MYIIKYFHTVIWFNKDFHINAGLYMGYAWALKDFLSILCKYNDCNSPETDDQVIIQNSCTSNKEFQTFFEKNVTIDTESKVFLNIYPTNFFTFNSNFKLTDGKVLINGSEPAFFHGFGNTNLDFVVQSYGYKNKGYPRKTYIVNAIKTYYKFFKIELILLSLFLVLFIFMFRKV